MKLLLPPGPPSVPLIGHMHIMNQLTHTGLARLAKQYGGVMFLRVGFLSTVVISTPDAAREVLKERMASSVTQTIRYLTYDQADMAFANYCPFWRQMSKVCVMKLFSRKRAESWSSVLEEIDGFIRTLESKSRAKVNLGELVSRLARNITFKAAFGSEFEDDQNMFIDDHMARAVSKGEDVSDMVDELLAFLGDEASAGAAKCRVMINAYAIGRDETAWKDADKFVPDRFAADHVPDFKGSHFELIPFGSGRRSCPGMQLGLYTSELAVARMVHCFNWTLPNLVF